MSDMRIELGTETMETLEAILSCLEDILVTLVDRLPEPKETETIEDDNLTIAYLKGAEDMRDQKDNIIQRLEDDLKAAIDDRETTISNLQKLLAQNQRTKKVLYREVGALKKKLAEKDADTKRILDEAGEGQLEDVTRMKDNIIQRLEADLKAAIDDRDSIEEYSRNKEETIRRQDFELLHLSGEVETLKKQLREAKP